MVLDAVCSRAADTTELHWCSFNALERSELRGLGDKLAQAFGLVNRVPNTSAIRDASDWVLTATKRSLAHYLDGLKTAIECTLHPNDDELPISRHWAVMPDGRTRREFIDTARLAAIEIVQRIPLIGSDDQKRTAVAAVDPRTTETAEATPNQAGPAQSVGMHSDAETGAKTEMANDVNPNEPPDPHAITSTQAIGMINKGRDDVNLTEKTWRRWFTERGIKIYTREQWFDNFGTRLKGIRGNPALVEASCIVRVLKPTGRTTDQEWERMAQLQSEARERKYPEYSP